jgi:hypothetical protein
MIRTVPLLLTLLFFWHSVLAQSSQLLQRQYRPSRASATVSFYLKEIQQQTGIEISYSDAYLKGRRRVGISQQSISLEEALNLLLASTGLSPLIQDGRLMLVPGAPTDKAISSASTLSGFIRDSASREVVIGAVIYVPGLQRGTATNTYGFYSLELPPGRHQVVVAAGGYSPDTIRMQLSSDLRRDVLLSYGLKLKEVTVSSRQDQRNDLIRLTRNEISQHAGLLGENDVLRGLQYTAGVQAAKDGSSDLVVRGGDPGQNLYLLDGVPLYYIDHMTGLTSVYNSDAVKAVDFYKGGFPSRYAGRLSSIVDVSSKDGDMKRFGGQASIGLLKGSLSLEGPIVKDEASISLTARRTWIDALWRPWLEEQLGLNFYDVNLKANWIIDPKNRIYVSAYNGRDKIKTDIFVAGFEALWGNSVGSVRWTSALRPDLFLNTSLSYSRFRYQLSSTLQEDVLDSSSRVSYTGRNSIQDVSLRVQADYYKSNSHHLQFGLHVSRAEFSPADLQIDTNYATTINPISAEPFFVTEINLYAEHDWKPVERLNIRTGLHASGWLYGRSRNDYSLQPRISADWRLNSKSAVFASAARMSQFLHQLSSDVAFFPADFWVPSTAVLRPEHAWTIAAGYRIKPQPSTSLKAEIYYRKLDQVIAYRAGVNIFESPIPWDMQLVQGEGSSYGVEAEVHQQLGPVRADLCYTLSKSTRRFAELNQGNPFPFRHDRRHCVKSSLLYQKRKRFNAIAEYTYMSGEAITVPDQLYPDYDKNITGQYGSSPFTYNNSARNNYRMPAIQRLDLAVNFVRERGRHFERTWTLGVYNFLANHNIAYAEILPNDNGGYKLSGISFFRFIPTVSYAVRF